MEREEKLAQQEEISTESVAEETKAEDSKQADDATETGTVHSESESEAAEQTEEQESESVRSVREDDQTETSSEESEEEDNVEPPTEEEAVEAFLQDHIPVLQEKLKQVFPEQEISEKNVMKLAMDYLDDLESYHQRSMEKNKQFLSLFEEDNQLYDMLEDMAKGAPFRVALAKHYDPEDFIPKDNDEDYKDYEKNKQERMAMLEKRKTWEQEFELNQERSAATLESFVEKQKLSEDETSSLIKDLESTVSNLVNGIIDEQFLEYLRLGKNFDKEMQKVAKVAEVKGRNEAISKKIEKEAKSGDGLPTLKKATQTTPPTPQYKTPIDDVLDRQQRRKII